MYSYHFSFCLLLTTHLSIHFRTKVDNRQQKLIIFDPIPIDFIKEIKSKANVSLNDVLLAAWSHAIREYCYSQKCPVIKSRGEKALCRATMTYGFPNGSSHPALAMRNLW
jgi:hypothetical protein